MRSRRAKGALVSLSLALGAALGVNVAAPAAAAVDQPLLISHDGVSYSPGSDVALFTELDRIIPGDTVTERVWLRNDTQDVGLLRLELVGVTASGMDLASATQVSFADAAGVELARLTIADAVAAGSSATVADGLVLAPGETLGLDTGLSVEAALGSRPGDGGREGVLDSVAFQLRATLWDAQAGPAGPGDGGLPATGVVGMPALMIAVGFLGVGAFLTVMFRRRGVEE